MRAKNEVKVCAEKITVNTMIRRIVAREKVFSAAKKFITTAIKR
jgi:hypothetical protein